MRDKTFNIAKNENISNKELADEFHKPVIKKFNKIKVQSPFIDNIWGADLADMQIISKFNKEFIFLWCAIDIYSKYAWVIPLKDKKRITITNAFQKILDESKRRSNKIWVDQGSEFYNRSMKSWLEKNAIEMYSTYNKEKSVIPERFIKILKNKIYKYMTSISKNVFIDKLDDIINKYNNAYHNTIKIKPVDVKSNTYINSSKENNDKDPKFKVGDIVRLSKYKTFLQKVLLQVGLQKFLWLKKLKTLYRGHMLLVILEIKKLLERFMKKNYKTQIK